MNVSTYLSYFKTIVEKEEQNQNRKSLSIQLGPILKKLIQDNINNPVVKDSVLFKRLISFTKDVPIKAAYILPKNPNFIEFLQDFSGNATFTFTTTTEIQKKHSMLLQCVFPYDQQDFRVLYTAQSLRVEGKAGRVLSSLFDKIDLKELETFINLVKENNQDTKRFDNFEEVSGDLINHYYNAVRYERANDSLNGEGGYVGELLNSCMRHNNCFSYISFYSKNTECVKLLILKGSDNKIRGRALLWKTTKGFTCIDRMYTSGEDEKNLFKAYATKHGYVNIYDRRHGQLFSIDDERLPEVQLNYVPSLGEFLPYLDSMRLLDITTGKLYTGVREYISFPPTAVVNKLNPKGIFFDISSGLTVTETIRPDMFVISKLGNEHPINNVKRITRYSSYIEDPETIYMHATKCIKTYYNTYIDVDIRNNYFCTALINSYTCSSYVLKTDAYWSDYHKTYIHKDYVVYDEGTDCVFHKDVYSEKTVEEYVCKKNILDQLDVFNLNYSLSDFLERCDNDYVTVVLKEHAKLLAKVFDIEYLEILDWNKIALIDIKEDKALLKMKHIRNNEYYAITLPLYFIKYLLIQKPFIENPTVVVINTNIPKVNLIKEYNDNKRIVVN
jgi:hypothetical protein